MKIPLYSVHKGHPIGDQAGIHQVVDKQIIAKVDDLVSKSITNTNEVKRCLQEYVQKELFGNVPEEERPDQTNRRFYPSKKDLQNHIARSVLAKKSCKDDQEALRRKIENWQKASPETKFYYRTCSPACEDQELETSQKSTFLFVHQEPWQQRLLTRYGSNLVLMDATYKTTKYALPLFFICVNTNTGYKVVAEFITQYEDQQSISEAIEILKSWNPTWSPKYWMLDYSSVEISAVEEQFPKSVAYICDFHRLQAWQRWVRKTKNGLTLVEQEELMQNLKKIANAKTKEEYEDAVEELREVPLYKEKENVKKYIENTWLTCAFRWARAFRIHEADHIVNTNNGVEAQNRLFKYNYLPYSIDKSVYGIATMLVETFIPESYKTYQNMNMKLSGQYRSYNAMVPKYLHNRPPLFIKHCLKSQFSAEEYRDKDIVCQDIQQGVFRVRSSTTHSKHHTIQCQVPSCTCESWERSHFPCKHFYAVFNFYAEWSFEKLPSLYRNSAFVTLDSEMVKSEERNAENSGTSCTVDPPIVTINNDEEMDIDQDTHELVGTPTDPTNSTDKQIGTLQKQLQEQLKKINDVSYLVDDGDALQQTLEQLKAIHQDLQKHCKLDDGLRLRLSPHKKRLRLTSTDYHKVFYKKLQRRKKYKRKEEQKQSFLIDLSNCNSEKWDQESETNVFIDQKANKKIVSLEKSDICSRNAI